MTIAEVILAERGYMSRIELEANLVLMATRQANTKKPKMFDFATKPQSNGSGVNQSTLDERKRTLEALNAF